MFPPIDGGPAWVAVEGPSGVGKTTLVRALAERTGRRPIPEAHDAATDPPSLEFESPSDLARLERKLATLEFRRYRTANDLRARRIPLLLDTGFLGPLTYSMGLREVLGVRWDVSREVSGQFARAAGSGTWGLPDLTLYLDAPADAVSRRYRAALDSHPARLAHRHARVARWEKAYWLNRIARGIPGRVYRVPARGDLVATVDRALAHLRTWTPRARPTRAEARAVLAVLEGGSTRRNERPRSATLKKGTLSPRPPRR